MKTLKKDKKRSSGFTILEIVVGILIASMVLVFSYTSVNFSAAVCSDMEEEARVASILESAAERIFNTSFSSIATGMSFTSNDIPLLSLFPSSTLAVTVSEYAGNPSLKSVTITFSWTPASQRSAKSQTLNTLVAESF